MRNIWTNLLFFAFVLLLVLLLEGEFSSTPSAPSDTPLRQGVTYGVQHVIDGDTVVVRKGGKEETIRLIGIDTPESEHAPGGPECFHAEATAKARELLEGEDVVVMTDPTQDERDTYDRLLGYITLPDGTDFGAHMIEGGFANENTFKGRAYERQSTYRQLVVTAEANDVGMWSCD